MKLFELLSQWESKGKPIGAMFTTPETETWECITDMFPLDPIVFNDYDGYRYKDPPEQWLDIESAQMVVKLQFGYQIRCKPKRNSLDDAFDEWCSIDGLLLSDIFKFDFQYLSKA